MKYLKEYNEHNGPVDGKPLEMMDDKALDKNIRYIKDIILKFEDSGDIITVHEGDIEIYYNAVWDGFTINIYNNKPTTTIFSSTIYLKLKSEFERHGLKIVDEHRKNDLRMMFVVMPKYDLRPL